MITFGENQRKGVVMRGVWVGASLKANELCNDTVNEITEAAGCNCSAKQMSVHKPCVPIFYFLTK